MEPPDRKILFEEDSKEAKKIEKQNVREALKVSDRVVVMKAGSLILEARPEELADNARLMELY